MNGPGKRAARWRLILGEDSGLSAELGEKERGVDRMLSELYARREEFNVTERGAGKGIGGTALLDHLAELRGIFPADAAAVIQSDIVERTELRKLLPSPKALALLKHDHKTASLLLAMRNLIPERSREAARAYVREVSDAIRKKLEPGLLRAVAGALARREDNTAGAWASVNLKRTVEKNLRNYDVESGRIIPEKLCYRRRARVVSELEVVLALDQSASMSGSMLYASVLGSVLCGIPALNVSVVAFDHRVADISQACREDSVGALFGLQLGGGTDIVSAVDYCSGLVLRPEKTLFILLTDLFDAVSAERLETSIAGMTDTGAFVLVLLALGDSGAPEYNAGLAARLAGRGVVCASCSPESLVGLLEGVITKMRCV